MKKLSRARFIADGWTGSDTSPFNYLDCVEKKHYKMTNHRLMELEILQTDIFMYTENLINTYKW